MTARVPDEDTSWCLHVTSWAGHTPGAVHFYGYMEHQAHDGEHDSITVTRVLSAGAARALEHAERTNARYALTDFTREAAERATYREGDETERFTDLLSLVDRACAVFTSTAPPGHRLYRWPNYITADPDVLATAPERQETP